MHAFREVETAAYCPRKLYYRRRSPEPEEVPREVTARRELAFRYEELLADDAAIRDAPVAVTPTQYRSRLGAAKAGLDDWESLSGGAASDSQSSRPAFAAPSRERYCVGVTAIGASLIAASSANNSS